jgi:hypothetical protein
VSESLLAREREERRTSAALLSRVDISAASELEPGLRQRIDAAIVSVGVEIDPPSAGRGRDADRANGDPGQGNDRGLDPDGRGRDPDGRGRDPDGRGRDPDGRGRDPDGRGRDPDGREGDPDRRGRDPDVLHRDHDGQRRDPDDDRRLVSDSPVAVPSGLQSQQRTAAPPVVDKHGSALRYSEVGIPTISPFELFFLRV